MQSRSKTEMKGRNCNEQKYERTAKTGREGKKKKLCDLRKEHPIKSGRNRTKAKHPVLCFE